MGASGKNSNGHAGELRANVSAEANSGEPSIVEYEKMARRRFQAPKPKREGRWWYLLVWEDEFVAGKRTRKRKRKKIAPASMLEREVRKIAAELMRPVNQGLITVGSATRFEDYVEGTYKPVVLPLMVKSTQDRYQSVIKNYLIPTFGACCLRDVTPLAVQRYLSGTATSGLAHESQDKIRDVLSSVLGSAMQYGLLVKNPVEGLRLPPAKRGKRIKPFVSPEQFSALLACISEPYATMVFVAVYTGLRISELIGLKWRNVHEDSITIEERCCRGDWGCPKSEASNATIAVNAAVIERIHCLKGLTVEVKAGRAVRRYRVVKSDGPDDLVFQSVQRGRPMRDNTILSRFLKPAGRKVGMGWVNWQVLRRSHATWLKLVGADIKDAQAQMRHSRASTTLDIYQQFVPASQRKAVDRLGQLVPKTSMPEGGSGLVN
jgi:integrase